MTGTSVFFDTWAWVEVLRNTRDGKALAARYLRPSDPPIWTSMISLAELSALLHPHGQDVVEQSLNLVESRSRIHPITTDHVRHAGALRAMLGKSAPRASLADALILAAAKDVSIPLISGDSAFEGQPNVRRS